MLVPCVKSNEANDKAASLSLLGAYKENPMSVITGRLLINLLPNGTVRIMFIANNGGGNTAPLTVRNLDEAERAFIRTFCLTPERALELRAELERNKVFCIQMSPDNAVAAMFRRS